MKKRKKVIGYKVVNVRLDNTLSSSFMRDFMPVDDKKLEGKYCVIYEVGKLAKPKLRGTKLFAFKTYEDARKYLIAVGGRIYKAECNGVTEDGYLPSFMSNMTYLLAFFKGEAWRGQNQLFGSEHPALHCTSIKLLKEIQ